MAGYQLGREAHQYCRTVDWIVYFLQHLAATPLLPLCI